jgi:hypothetical protein
MKLVLFLVIFLAYILMHFHFCKIEILTKFDKVLIVVLILGGMALLFHYAPPPEGFTR